MSGRPTEASARAAKLVAGGLSYRAAAKAAGVSLSTCYRAVLAARSAAGKPAAERLQPR
jgi:transposase